MLKILLLDPGLWQSILVALLNFVGKDQPTGRGEGEGLIAAQIDPL
jgi:hypothetical protein